ncbi:hypothetical protein [Leptolyngbya sp. BL0902]|uniref:hypothetical protein n=1 Tax=Leptolyngbya sp. BL0902 TaxID=1115757 RepID=UPI0018E7360A|nr:hypothetical protein [Leptolyngbya sp. BL0902]
MLTPRPNPIANRWLGLGGSLMTAQGLDLISPAQAHQVQTSATVGGTLHIEPNDTPRAQEDSLIWLALTQRGGRVIPLEDCYCTLRIYQGNTMLAQPYLQPITAEGYQNIPSATFMFPAVGAYTVVLEGRPQNDAEFEPFELSYNVTVAAAAPVTPQTTATDWPTEPALPATLPEPDATVPSALTVVLVIAAASGLLIGVLAKLRS